jgi:uncharacterized protein YciI
MPSRSRGAAVAALLLVLSGRGMAASAAPADSLAGPSAEPVHYRLGLLTRGASWTPERTPHADSIQAGHLANIGRMSQLGALVAAGPFTDGGDLQGVFVFAPEAAGLDTLLAGDPAIASKRLECRIYPWVAPPGLGDDYKRRSGGLDRTVQGEPDSMVSFGWVMLRRGPHYDSSPTPAVMKLLVRHGDYMRELRASGQLVYAGDIAGTGELRGVLVMQGDSAQVARAVRADPAVKAKRYTTQILRWWTAWGTLPGH